MTENDVRDQICRIGASLFERGYVHGTAGNISVRVDGGLIMTPTDACLGFLDPARLARLDARGTQLSGERASKSSVLHRRIYESARQFDVDTRCVIHTHSRYCVAAALRGTCAELLPPLTPYFVMKVGRVPVIAYERPGAPEVAEQVARTIERYGAEVTPIRAVMLDRLGPVVWHDGPGPAMAVLEELEETARLRWLSAPEEITPLDEAQIDELRRAFGARW